ncbi:regulatory protein RecX [Legionella geestiana]|uniref:regulatory protein RecX n=1 Tax=Legionella geestiana TaxID=45065 RepID=UPI001091D401|nr:regulatory protein RecX [Legionella geestiana]QDQ39585.1 regulatory protein RecX [Legionella geestiana]
MSDDAYSCALRWLVRREYGAEELLKRLEAKGFGARAAREALEALQEQGYQSDVRFCEMLCRTRIRQGYGPRRIAGELRMLGVSPTLISAALNDAETDWEALARAVWEKKFSAEEAGDSPDSRARQQRFLLYRGFEADMVSRLLKT